MVGPLVCPDRQELLGQARVLNGTIDTDGDGQPDWALCMALDGGYHSVEVGVCIYQGQITTGHLGPAHCATTPVRAHTQLIKPTFAHFTSGGFSMAQLAPRMPQKGDLIWLVPNTSVPA